MPESILYHDGNRQLQDEFNRGAFPTGWRKSWRAGNSPPTTRPSSKARSISSSRPRTARAGRIAPSRAGLPASCSVTGPSELAFPDYDGNGMFKSLGNLAVNGNVGLLFIAMHGKPKRLRVNGTATREP